VLQLKIFSIKDLIKVLEHFDKYPLLSQKKVDYELFKQAINIIKKAEHLTTDGLNKIVKIKACINKGLSDELKLAFLMVAAEVSQAITSRLRIQGLVSPN